MMKILNPVLLLCSPHCPCPVDENHAFDVKFSSFAVAGVVGIHNAIGADKVSRLNPRFPSDRPRCPNIEIRPTLLLLA